MCSSFSHHCADNDSNTLGVSLEGHEEPLQEYLLNAEFVAEPMNVFVSVVCVTLGVINKYLL